MRFLILTLISICISSGFAYNLNSYRSYSARARVPDVQLHVGPNSELRTKRDIHIHQLDDLDDCIRNCTYDMQDRLDGFNDTDDEVTKARVLCQTLEPMGDCYKSCPDTKLRTLMMDFLPMMKTPCLLGIDRIEELQKVMDCLNSTSDLVADKCDPVCNGSFSEDDSKLRVDSRVVLNVDPAFILYDDDKKENTDVLRATCKFLTCEQQCGDPITKAHCGQLGVDVDRKSTSTIFGSIIKIYKDMDALEGSIDECKSIL